MCVCVCVCVRIGLGRFGFTTPAGGARVDVVAVSTQVNDPQGHDARVEDAFGLNQPVVTTIDTLRDT